ncbi:MAG: dihydrolipoamide acetyltransferase family protein, partial [Nitrososphaerales archaeon]
AQGHERITAADVRPLVEASAKRFSSPRARKHAREAGIDWRELRGSGPRGRVIERDVLAAGWPQVGAPPASTALTPPDGRGAVRWQDPTPVQRIAAEHTTATWTTIPHFYLTSEASAEALVEMRERLLPAVERRAGVRLTITDLLVKIAATALAEHPAANAFWDSGRIGLYRGVDVGIATATGAGLLVPVLHGADHRSLAEIARERARLVNAARTGKLSPDDLAGGTFTLSNLGAHRVDQFQPVLNSSPNASPSGAQSVILAAGRIAPRPFVVNDQLAVARTIVLSIACDHRVLDGTLAAAFFDRLIQLIEEPYELLV